MDVHRKLWYIVYARCKCVLNHLMLHSAVGRSPLNVHPPLGLSKPRWVVRHDLGRPLYLVVSCHLQNSGQKRLVWIDLGFALSVLLSSSRACLSVCEIR